MTDKKPTKQEIREFWRYFGFTKALNIGEFGNTGELENGKYANLNITFDNIFKYAIPKLIFERWDLDIDVSLSGKDGVPGTDVTFTLNKLYRGAIVVDKQFNSFNENPELALFEAIYEVIKAEKSKT